MDNSIFEHIVFLLPRHNCVIIPGFGGFIINSEPSIRKKNNSLNSPSYTIIFNQELKHDDGLLISSIQGVKDISYTIAANIISDSVKDIKNILKQGNTVVCGKLGILKQDTDGNIVFHNNAALFPASLGLTPVSLKLIDSINQQDNTERKRSQIIRRIGSAAAIIAGIFLFITPSFNVGSIDKGVQKANFLDIFTQSVIESNSSNEIEIASEASAENNIEANKEYAAEKPARTYFIVIGGEETESNANKLLSKFQTQGFSKAAIIKSDRYRIYVASFFDKNEAERYLDIFRLENPKYSTAWLYSKKNN